MVFQCWVGAVYWNEFWTCLWSALCVFYIMLRCNLNEFAVIFLFKRIKFCLNITTRRAQLSVTRGALTIQRTRRVDCRASVIPNSFRRSVAYFTHLLHCCKNEQTAWPLRTSLPCQALPCIRMCTEQWTSWRLWLAHARRLTLRQTVVLETPALDERQRNLDPEVLFQWRPTPIHW